MTQKILVCFAVLLAARTLRADLMTDNVKAAAARIPMLYVNLKKTDLTSDETEVWVRPSKADSMKLLELLRNRKVWLPDGSLGRYWHHAKLSFRQRYGPSPYLHVLVYERAEGYEFALHLDRYFAAARCPVSMLMHFFLEVAPHFLLQTRTSQTAMQSLLAE